MNLLDQIIDLLSNEAGSLSEALLKTKVLLHRIGQQDLIEWVNHELNGYPDDVEVPAYRQMNATVVGNLTTGYQRWENHLIPIGHLSKDKRDQFEKRHFRESIAVLQQHASHKQGWVSLPIPHEVSPMLSKSLTPGIEIESAWIRIAVTQMTQAVTEVRSRLLDFILTLQGRLPADLPDAALLAAAANVDAKGLFNNAVFGDGVMIVMGNHNTVSAQTSIGRGDFAALARLLREHRVSDLDITELEAAIKADETTFEVGQKRLGPQVSGWIKGMMSKAVDAAWNIELGVAGGLLTNALQAYYFS